MKSCLGNTTGENGVSWQRESLGTREKRLGVRVLSHCGLGRSAWLQGEKTARMRRGMTWVRVRAVRKGSAGAPASTGLCATPLTA
eukprot:1160064-Pelagomonas_calceolata.AAC.1